MRVARLALTCTSLCCLGVVPLRAQDTFDQPPPHIAFVDGSATLDREDVSEPAAPGAPLVPGDRVRTARGRVEVLFPDGSALDVDEYSSFELQAAVLLRATSGRVLLVVAGASDPRSASHFQIDTPIASAQTDGPGEYRISILSGPTGDQTELAVVRGSASLVTERGSMPLRAGERSVAWDDAVPSAPQFFNSARFDAFDQWALARRDDRLGSQSARYLPPDLRMYGGALDRSGSWQYDDPYGYVWYPAVDPGWRPYYDGYWSAVPTYGWTWIGSEAWSWPTHHYGRWGFGANRWFWMPDRHWGPAWVTWGEAPGYVSWCPLGFNNRPVFAFSVSARNSWTGWTVLTRDHFGERGRNVHQSAVSPRSLPANTPFITRAAAPVAPPRAVPRRLVGGSSQRTELDGRRPATNGRQPPLARQPSPGEGGPSTAVIRRPATDDRRSSATGQPPAASRLPQAVSRQPRPAPDQPQPADRPAEDRYNTGAFRSPLPDTPRGRRPDAPDSPVYTNRSRIDRPSASAPAHATTPASPPNPGRSRYGSAPPRSESAPPPTPPTAPPSFQGVPAPRRNPAPAPRYERPSAPPPAAAAPAPRAERPPTPPRERDSQQARPRGRENQQSSQPSAPQHQPEQGGNGANGHGSRRPR
jgi:Family of unknown function (DUF6600)/FecR protein